MDFQSSDAASRQRRRNRLTTISLAVVGGGLIVAVIVLAIVRAYNTEEARPTPTLPAVSAIETERPRERAIRARTGDRVNFGLGTHRVNETTTPRAHTGASTLTWYRYGRQAVGPPS